MPNNTHSIDYELSSTQFSNVADNAALSITGDISMEAWVKLEQLPSTAGTNFALGGKYTIAQPSWNWFISTADKMIFTWYSSADTGINTNVTSNSAVITAGEVNKWIHFMVTVDVSAKDGTIYKNTGVVASTDTDTGGGSTSIFDGTADFTVGALSESTQRFYFDGKINNIRLWSDIRTSGELSTNWKQVLTGTGNNLVGSWYANNNHNDMAGSNNLTANSSPVFTTDIPFPLLSDIQGFYNV